MSQEEEYDWAGFIINFIFSAIPTWLVVGIVVWKYNPEMNGSKVFFIACLASVVVGIIAGIKRAGFWGAATKMASYSPYSKNKKDSENDI